MNLYEAPSKSPPVGATFFNFLFRTVDLNDFRIALIEITFEIKTIRNSKAKPIFASR